MHALLVENCIGTMVGLSGASRWVQGAGGVIKLEGRNPQGLEVSPTVSYAGEELQALCAGRTLAQAYDVFLQVSWAPPPLPRPQTHLEANPYQAAQYHPVC